MRRPEFEEEGSKRGAFEIAAKWRRWWKSGAPLPVLRIAYLLMAVAIVVMALLNLMRYFGIVP